MPWTNSSAFYTFLWTRTDIRIVLLTALMWKWHDNLFILLPEVFCFFHLFISMLHFVNGCVIFLVCEHRYLMWCNSFKFGAHQIVSVKVAQMISSISNSIVLSWHLNTSLSKLFLYFWGTSLELVGQNLERNSLKIQNNPIGGKFHSLWYLLIKSLILFCNSKLDLFFKLWRSWS